VTKFSLEKKQIFFTSAIFLSPTGLHSLRMM